MIVRTPVPGFCGQVAGVVFTDGAGTTSDAVALAYFRRAGYLLEREVIVTPGPVAVPEPPARSARKAEWLAFLLALHPERRAELERMSKAQLLDAGGVLARPTGVSPDHLVEPGDSGHDVDAETLVDEQPPDGAQVVDPEQQGEGS